MKVSNVRAGFATNSSSSHSVVILPQGSKWSPNARDHYDDLNFGWEYFVCKTPEDKMKYMAAQIWSSLSDSIDRNVLAGLIENWTGCNVTPYMKEDSDEPVSYHYDDISVDHQSRICFDNWKWSNETRDKFFTEMAKYFQQDRVIVLGGNDNSDIDWETPPGTEKIDWVVNFTDTSRRGLMRCDGEYFILFNRDSGHKMRFTFNDRANPYTKSSTPELVDLKITNYCPYECEFCYQASTKKGLHGETSKIYEILNTLSELNVFEVAIGGGEPTMHPDFGDILKYTFAKDIIPNFTTYSVAWLKDDELVKTVIDTCGGVGVSVHNSKDLAKVDKIAEALNGRSKSYGGVINYHNFWGGKGVQVLAQHVIGTLPVNETALLLTECWDKGIPILLLGYKTVGNGGNYEQHDMSDLPLYLKLMVEKRDDHSYYHNTGETRMLSVDTAFAEKFKNVLNDLGVSDVLLTSQEGSFSCYIDAVRNQAAPSSYSPDSEYVNLDVCTPLSFKDVYAKF